jgi:Holliday junction DNA helicase RuvA
MIARIEGKLLQLNTEPDTSGLVQVESVCYEVMLPGYCVSALADKIGSNISLCTMEYYEGAPGGGNLIPRMIGFLSTQERDFFTKFTSVKGIGIRKALRLLSIPISTIAAAIENDDNKTLQMLNGVGQKMARQIIAELKGKLKTYALGAESIRLEAKFKPFQIEAMEVLIAWGEKRNEAMELIQLACERHPDIKTAEALVPLVYRLKQGVEV